MVGQSANSKRYAKTKSQNTTKVSGIKKSESSMQSPPSSSFEETKLFLKKIQFSKPHLIPKLVSQFESLWLSTLSNKSLPFYLAEQVILLIARVPPSADIPMPELKHISNVFTNFLMLAKKNVKAREDEDFMPKQIDSILNAVKRLLLNAYSDPKNEVKDCFDGILTAAMDELSNRNSSHRRASMKINDLLEELEKPWAIKLKLELISLDVASNDTSTRSENWRDATIEWLMNANILTPPKLPVMKVPTVNDASNGVYESVDDYFSTILPLWIGMTFGEGYSTLNPVCGTRDGDKSCNHTLWPMPNLSMISCRTKGCKGSVEFACPNSRHDFGLCKPCNLSARKALIGPAGQRASTNIYDGIIKRVDFEGNIFMEKVLSRRPPQNPIHWRSTRRLSSPNLVGIVKVSSFGKAMAFSDSITWAKVILHQRSDARDECRMREAGKVAVVSLTASQKELVFQAGDSIVIIDCQTFVPEFIPVLEALEKQKLHALPFQNGRMLNIGDNDNSRTEKQSAIIDLSSETVTKDHIMNTIVQLVDSSLIEPIIELRRDPSIKAVLLSELTALVQGATLDNGQFKSFVSSLQNPVHCTQGPPGTGKSYVGVIMTRAFLIIRKLWMRANPSIGQPPILILSYKNRAIDDFLVDIVKQEPHLNMVRIGKSSTNPLLAKFSERSYSHKATSVIRWKQTVQDLYAARGFSGKILGSHDQILLSKAVDDEPDSSNSDTRIQRALEYKTAEGMKDIILRVFEILHVFEVEMEESFDWRQEQIDQLDEGDPDNVLFLLAICKTGRLQNPRIKFTKLIDLKNPMSLGEMMWMFMKGMIPPSKCLTDSCALIAELEKKYCIMHLCRFDTCNFPRSGSGNFCESHGCSVEGCENNSILMDNQDFCEIHTCFICFRNGDPSNIAVEDPPRNTCVIHLLCQFRTVSSETCDSLVKDNNSYCKIHEDISCLGLTKRNKPCSSKTLISMDIPYCKMHYEPPVIKYFSMGVCQGRNKKGKPCKSKATGSNFCSDHKNQGIIDTSKTVAIKNVGEIAIPPPTLQLTLQNSDSAETLSEMKTNDRDFDIKDIQLQEGGFEIICEEDIIDSIEESDKIDSIDESKIDNLDEVEESDYLQHMREVYEVEEEVDDLILPEFDTVEPIEDQLNHGVKWTPFKMWSWDMSFEQRWKICEDVLALDRVLVMKLEVLAIKHAAIARQEYQRALTKANSAVYEGKELIGGTIVGCIARLEAIRATNPFAILVEEGSEVLEPLIFACLGPSTRKLEMVGDHLQLQPSIMSKFDFERLNKINVSMFERLIRAEGSEAVASNVLSIQRRMRKNICDLTREFYTDITEIVDHDVCQTKAIGSALDKRVRKMDLSLCQGKGLLVPGISAQIFFWSHSGNQGRAAVGLSKVNKTEADMACHLAQYLVDSGVPKPSIAILTPYKGQLMLIQKQLGKAKGKLIPRDDPDSVVLSTVDRFQGDEADIIIISLVIDANSQTPFVKLVNRMIVLLSRARIGLYILGNIGYFEKRPADHWKRVFENLEQETESDIHPDLEGHQFKYDGPRVGSEINICCPLHRLESTAMISKAEDLKIGFCRIKCTEILRCSHECLTNCHWPNLSHNKQCDVELSSPCHAHPQQLKCHAVIKANQTIDDLSKYRCDTKVDITLPCGHGMRVDCSMESKIAAGQRSYPDCTEMGAEPFIYSDCKHSKDLVCTILQKYLSNPALAGQCLEVVNYIAPCGHSSFIKCYHKKNHISQTSIFICPERLMVNLPRCGHTKSVSCSESIKLSAWKGRACLLGIVEAGLSYGEIDSVCSHETVLEKKCGHQVKIECKIAFEMARNSNSLCEIIEKIQSPICGHIISVKCSEKQVLIGLNCTMTAITEVHENTHVADIFNNTDLPVQPNCTHKVVFHRNCGHQESISCSLAKQTLCFPSKCVALVDSTSPLCGHKINLPCHLVGIWTPWSTEFMQSSSYHQLLTCNILEENVEAPIPVPADLARHTYCKTPLVFQRLAKCKHQQEMMCYEAFKQLEKSPPACEERVEVELPCKHRHEISCHQTEEFRNNLFKVICKKNSLKNCWNFSICGSLIEARCDSSALICCSALIPWTCSLGHILTIPQCKGGVPDICSKCGVSSLKESMNELQRLLAGDCVLNAVNSLPEISPEIRSNFKSLNDRESLKDYIENKEDQLSLMLDLIQNTDAPDQFIVYPSELCVFSIEFNECSFSTKSIRLSDQSRGLEVLEWNSENLKKIIASHKQKRTISILLGFGFCLNTLIDPKFPKKKDSYAWFLKQKSLGVDNIYNSKTKKISFLEPYCLTATHHLVCSIDELSEIIESMSDKKHVFEQRTKITFKRTLIKALPNEAELERVTKEFVLKTKQVTEITCKTIGKNVPLLLNWDGVSFGTHEVLTAVVEKDLNIKLSFCSLKNLTAKSKKTNPFSGINYVKSLKISKDNIIFGLLDALEYEHMDMPEFEDCLKNYVRDVKARKTTLHPLALLALSRLSTTQKNDQVARELLVLFSSLYPDSHSFLKDSEKSSLNPQISAVLTLRKKDSARDVWASIQSQNGCGSRSMEKLLNLVGLEKVKLSALKLFRTALAIAKMSPEDQKNNGISLNQCFMGNPGTGKTTIARLLGEILHDSGIRSSRVFVECTAQKLMDDGTDEFRKSIEKAEGGVLFIDEIYDLDPKVNNEGRKIISELLTASENLRDTTTFIIAGYENEIHKKIFSFNQGLKSRFNEVLFEDFDEGDLESIWTGMLATKKWTSDAKISSFVAKKLVSAANKVGFGNARTVRKIFENSIQNAFNRKDFDGTLHLKLEDVAGVNPLDNEKLTDIIRELNQKIGWDNIKVAVKEMVSQAAMNYERALKGLKPLPIFMNRMFLGNPGTGKTTCAIIFGQILKHLNYLSIGEVVKKTASDFVGQHVGESASKTNDILSQAAGKILVIDEAYNLNDNLYGKQVLDVLVEKIQGTPSDDIAVLLLGYETPMCEMLRVQNAGLARRFPKEFAFRFDDYSDSEMLKILQQYSAKEHIQISSVVAEKIITVLSRQRASSNFGNVGSLLLLVQSAVSKAVQRCPSELIALKPEDVDSGVNTSLDPYLKLDTMKNLNNIKAELIKIQNNFKVALQEGSETPNLGHFVFRGSPGTGKTTVARIMADILFNLQILATNKVVETSGLELTGQYVGQTKTKVNDKLGEARGAVLFIDEAYELGKGLYGEEAMTTLLAAMTSPEHEGTVIIIAGYSDDIDQMLKRNQGLKSRFTNYFEFIDWTGQDCVEYILEIAEEENYEVEAEIEDHMEEKFDELRSLDGWANGRDVVQLWRDILKERASRVLQAAEIEKHIYIQDIKGPFEKMVVARNPAPSTYKSHKFDIGHALFESMDSTSSPLKSDQCEEIQIVQEHESDTSDDELADQLEDIRDDGVSDEEWAELEIAKQNAKKEFERQILEAARIKELKDQLERDAAIAKLEFEKKELEAIQVKLRSLSPCPAGFEWLNVGGGWKCSAGGHYVSNQQLNEQFTH